MPWRTLFVMLIFVLLVGGADSPSKEKPAVTADIDETTIAEFANLGGKLVVWPGGMPIRFRKPMDSVKGVPGFDFYQLPKDTALPEVKVPFGIHINSTTAADLDVLAKQKSLAFLSLNGANKSTNADLQKLAGLEKLIALEIRNFNLSEAQIKGLASIKSLEMLDLNNRRRLTADDLKELARLENLKSLKLGAPVSPAKIVSELAAMKKLESLGLELRDDVLTEIAKAGLLHVLVNSKGKGGTRPKTANDVVTFRLDTSNPVNMSLKELKALRNLELLDVVIINDKTVQRVHEGGLLHLLKIAAGKDGTRPKSADEVTHLDMSKSATTNRALREFAEFKNRNRSPA